MSAAEAPGLQLKADIGRLLDKLEANTHGFLKWDGADRTDIREEGDAAIADFTNARISIGLEAKAEAKPAKRARVIFDHIEIRRAPAPEGASKLSFGFPREAILQAPEHGESKLTLMGATASVLVDTQSGRARASEAAFTGARIDDKATGDWVTFGPLSFSSKIVAAADGKWTGPIDFELKQVEFFATQGPASGAIDRIAYAARSAGPDLAAVNRLRDKVEALREQNLSPPAQRDAMLALLPGILSLFTEARGELTIDGLVVRGPTDQPFVALKEVSLGGALTGLSSEAAAWRVTLKHDGLSVAPSLLPAEQVPQHAVVDVGIEDVATGPLRSILEAVGKMHEGASDEDKQHAEQQIVAAAATLTPTFRIYDAALETPDIGIAAIGEAKGSPLSPKGYSAAVDVAVRGFDALTDLVGKAPPAAYLPLLREIGTPAKADDGAPRLKFHLASTPQKLITVNGSDVSAWFRGNAGGPDKPRELRPAEPAMTGADVRAVQRALADAKITTPQNGAYDGATAVAVARFQKANGLNVDGVVDGATRQKLGVKPEPVPPNGPGRQTPRAN